MKPLTLSELRYEHDLRLAAERMNDRLLDDLEKARIVLAGHPFEEEKLWATVYP